VVLGGSCEMEVISMYAHSRPPWKLRYYGAFCCHWRLTSTDRQASSRSHSASQGQQQKITASMSDTTSSYK
jgi:hypothetical protein